MPFWIIENTLIAAVLALCVALGCRLLRTAPVIRHALWLVVFIRLIVPPVFSLGLKLPAIRLDWLATGNVAESAVESGDPVAAESDRTLRTQTEVTDLAAACDALPEAIDDPARGGEQPYHDPPSADPITASRWQLDGEREIAASGVLDQSGLDEGLLLEGELPVLPSAEIASETRDRIPRVDQWPNRKLIDQRTVLETDNLAAHAGQPAPAVSIQWAFLAVALSGTLLLVAIQGTRLFRLWRLLRLARPAPPEFVALVEHLAGQMRSAVPRVHVSSEINSPILCALGPAVLLWPRSRMDDLSDAARQAVIVHELAHLARRDHWVGWLDLVSSCCWWWNPLFWYVRHQLHENAELACDAWVTGLFPDERSAYARALVDLAELGSVGSPAAAVLGMTDGSRKLFERRLVMIMKDNVRFRLGALGLAAVGLLALAALPGCSTGQASEEPAVLVAVDESLSSDVVAGDAPVAESRTQAAPAGPGEIPAPAAEVIEPERGKPFTEPEPGKPLEGESLGLPNPEPPATAERIAPPAAKQPTAAEPAVSNEERLNRLENRLDVLLAEIRELKGQSSQSDKSGSKGMRPMGGQQEMMKSMTQSGKGGTSQMAIPAMPGMGMTGMQIGMKGMSGNKKGSSASARREHAADEVEAVTVTRSTYKLPAGRAEALAAFFRDNLTLQAEVGFDEIEVRVKGNALQVTAAADDQAVIGQFIRLLQTRGAPPADHGRRGADTGAKRSLEGSTSRETRTDTAEKPADPFVPAEVSPPESLAPRKQ